MILWQPAKITKDRTALVANSGASCYFTPAIFAVLFVRGMFVSMMPGTVVVFKRDVITTETMPAPVACKRDFVEYFSAIVAPVHYA